MKDAEVFYKRKARHRVRDSKVIRYRTAGWLQQTITEHVASGHTCRQAKPYRNRHLGCVNSLGRSSHLKILRIGRRVFHVCQVLSFELMWTERFSYRGCTRRTENPPVTSSFCCLCKIPHTPLPYLAKFPTEFSLELGFSLNFESQRNYSGSKRLGLRTLLHSPNTSQS